MKQRGGYNVAPPSAAATPSLLRPEPPVNRDASGGTATALSNPLSFSWTASAASASGKFPRCGERRCMAFRIDAGQPGTTAIGDNPRILISVAKLGKRNTSTRYKRNAVTMNYRRSTWQVWLNVSPAAVEGTKGPMPRIWQDLDGSWQSGRNAAVCPELQDYKDFCIAANLTKTSSQAVAISW